MTLEIERYQKEVSQFLKRAIEAVGVEGVHGEPSTGSNLSEAVKCLVLAADRTNDILAVLVAESARKYGV